MDTQRFVWALLFVISVAMVWEGWQKEQQAASAPATSKTASASAASSKIDVPVPTANAGASAVPGLGAVEKSAASAVVPRMTISTDLLKIVVSAEGGSIVGAELRKHRAAGDGKGSFTLFQQTPEHVYIAESGLIGNGLPNHKTVYQMPAGEVALADGKDQIQVRLVAPTVDGVAVDKVLTLRRDSYVVDVSYEIRNSGTAQISPYGYFQFLRDGSPAEDVGFMGSQTFTGPAIYTDATKYENFEFKDIDKGGIKYPQKAKDGWIAMVQHYFVAAWLPLGAAEREFFLKKVSDKLYTAGSIISGGAIPAGGTGKLGMSVYLGPQDQEKLKALAPGLDLVANYGWVTVIALPLFWVLHWIQHLVGNWGWAIIVLTILIKLAFFPLSAASYRSMARMRVVTPKMQKLKEQFGHDKAKLNQEMMELYKREKINPLGGCLPILVQIPVFIALYSVLLGTVEMRHAPWVLWITDLSSKDPYYVLPLIMGVSMLVQTKLNPTPPDPVQAKVMLAMPIIFTGMFLFFPSGLVLYWVVNNLLSIAQQWQITRMAESGQGAGGAE